MNIADAFAATTVEGEDLSRYVQVDPAGSLGDTVAAMTSAELSCACVIDDGVLVGLFTQRDVLFRVIGRDIDRGLPISDMMSTELKTVGPAASLADAVETMNTWWVRNLPVVGDDGAFVGNLSFFTVLQAMSAMLSRRFEDRPEADPVREGFEFIDFTGIALEPPVTVAADDPAEIAVHQLRNRGLEQVMVCDDRGHLLGVINEFELLMRLGCREVDLSAIPASEAMIHDPPVISVRASISDAIRGLRADQTSNIALVGETGRPVGVASFRQIAEYLETTLEAAR